jgi:hypothetical protein
MSFDTESMLDGADKAYPEMMPSGWYTAEIKDTSERPTKKGDGKYINMKFLITGPKYKGKFIWKMIHHGNKSTAAVDIAKEQMGAISKATGIAVWNSEEVTNDAGDKVVHFPDFIGKGLYIRVGVKKGTNGYKDREEVYEFQSLMNPPSEPTPVPVAGQKPDWA